MEPVKAPTVASSIAQVENDVLSVSEMEEMTGKQSADMTEKIFPKDISVLVTESLSDIWQHTFAIRRSGVCSCIFNLFRQLLLDLLRKNEIDKILDGPFSTSFLSDVATGKIDEKLLSTNFCKAPIAASIWCRTRAAIVTRRAIIKVEEEMNLLVSNRTVKQAITKSVSPPTCTDLATLSPSSKY